MKKLLFSVALFALACLFISGCSTGATKTGHDMAANGDNKFLVDVNPGLSLDQVKSAILASLVEREWTIISDNDGVISAELDRANERSVHGKIAITYSNSSIMILDSSVDAKGNPFVPVRWLKYLSMSMTKYMNATALAK